MKHFCLVHPPHITTTTTSSRVFNKVLDLVSASCFPLHGPRLVLYRLQLKKLVLPSTHHPWPKTSVPLLTQPSLTTKLCFLCHLSDPKTFLSAVGYNHFLSGPPYSLLPSFFPVIFFSFSLFLPLCVIHRRFMYLTFWPPTCTYTLPATHFTPYNRRTFICPTKTEFTPEPIIAKKIYPSNH